MKIRHAAIIAVGIVVSFTPITAYSLPGDAYWQPVNNSTNLAGVNTGFANDWKTYDLFLSLESGDAPAAFDFGIAGNNTGLNTDGIFYNGTPFSSDSVEPNIIRAPLIPDLEYDSAITINGGPTNVVNTKNLNGITWDPAGVVGQWFTIPVQMGAGGPNGPDDMWVARITVSANTSFLGGEMFAAGTGPNGDFGLNISDIPLGVIHIPNAIPTPSVLTLFGLAGAATIRRRR